MRKILFTKMMMLLLLASLSLLYAGETHAQSVIDVGEGVHNYGNGYFDLDQNVTVDIYGTLINENDADQDYFINGNVTLKDGGIFRNDAGNVHILGDLTLDASTASLFQNNGNIYVYGNIINNLPMGSMDIGQGKIILVGGTADADLGRVPVQTISGSQPFLTYDLEINNTAGQQGNGDVVLKQTVIVGNTATFTKGIITTPDNAVHPLVFGANSKNPVNPGDISHVNGVVRTLWPNGSFTYPVGDGMSYRKIMASITNNTAGLDAKYVKSDAGGVNGITAFTPNGGLDQTKELKAYNHGEYWLMNPVGTTTATLTVYYGPGQSNISDITDLRVAHQTSSAWWNDGSASGANAGSSETEGSVTSGVLNTEAQWNPLSSGTDAGWSPVTLGSVDLRSPLPVIIKSFTAQKENNTDGLLKWLVSDEQNLKMYAIERSCDGRNFTQIGVVAAAGKDNYQYLDKNVNCSKVLYRLRLVNNDGVYKYSNIVTLNFTEQDSHIKIYPNPVITQFNISIGAGNAGEYKVALYNAVGQLVYVSKESVNSAATVIPVQRQASFAAGNYILILRNITTGVTTIEKLIFK